MMLTAKFAVLKYSPSHLLGEVLNIGLLFFFKDRLEFVEPPSLLRIEHTFPQVDIQHLKRYLDAFKKTAKGLNVKDGFDTNTHLPHFLAKDSGTLYFSEPQSVFKLSEEEVKAHFTSVFFAPYQVRQ